MREKWSKEKYGVDMYFLTHIRLTLGMKKTEISCGNIQNAR